MVLEPSAHTLTLSLVRERESEKRFSQRFSDLGGLTRTQSEVVVQAMSDSNSPTPSVERLPTEGFLMPFP